MAKTSLKVKAARKPKFAVRGYTRCQRCGRPKAVYRMFGLCRICLREMAHRGELPAALRRWSGRAAGWPESHVRWICLVIHSCY
jgi:small subunit ribosomal protein S14